MPSLDPTLRDQLAVVIGKENTVGGARAVAEAGARAAIEALAVHLPAAHGHLDVASKQLRNRLRARARQLGDRRYEDGQHTIDRIVEQAAYEHWHRMLFARFLAENELLIHPEMKVAVTLEECAAMAAEEGAVDNWELASRYASRMLPQIFRPDDPLLALRFAIDDIHKLEKLLDSLPAALFRASDSLGWCYQFWQARKKKEINTSEVKIGANELPAVTQLFTEPYMVQFLLHNTLGAWWVGAGRALPVEMPYLRRLDDSTPAAGTFEGWPRLARELKVLDPCCGSGHFLVAAFELLVAFRMAEEGLTAQEACDAVLRDNLFGLEIDARCVQIAAFALALAAWTFPGAGGYRPLSAMNVACSGLAVSAKKEEWERLAGDNLRLRNGMGRMWELFKEAPVLGSLIDPTRSSRDPLYVAGPEEFHPLFMKALSAERSYVDDDRQESVVAAEGISLAAVMLSASYHLVITNVPYLTQGRQDRKLRDYAEMALSDAKNDLATMFLSRFMRAISNDGSMAIVLPQHLFFLVRYETLRRRLLTQQRFDLVANLGTGAFETISGEVVNVALLVLSKSRPDTNHEISRIDATITSIPFQKAGLLISGPITNHEQLSQLLNPDARLTFDTVPQGHLLEEYASCRLGIVSGDGFRWIRKYWEVLSLDTQWRRLQSTPETTMLFGGREHVINWSTEGEGMLRPGLDNPAFGRQGVAVSQMGALPATIYEGDLYDNNAAAIVPHEASLVPAIWAFCSSPAYNEFVRRIDKKMGVIHGSLLKVPFDKKYWLSEALKHYPNGLPEPSSLDPTQWVFKGYPRNSESPLQVAVARLLGYRWPDQKPDILDTLADTDGIVCIPALRGERPAADRLNDLLAVAWGKDWHPQTLTDLLAAVGHNGSLEEWLRDSFFKQHCELFKLRPFIWHIWDGHREGFSALVNYHKLDHEALKSLTYTYLGDWIRTQEIEAKAGKSGAGDKLAKAKALQQRLAAILEGEALPDRSWGLDIFVRWKPLEQQPIGWHPDLDDGVRLNIRPFLLVQDVAAKGAGVLRWKPNIKWGKDRGKNPPGAPWGEDRDNDLHLTLAQKRAARKER